MKKLANLLSIILSSLVLLSCNGTTNDNIHNPSEFLKTDGTMIKNDFGHGETISLRGINAGGYLVLEQWMCAIASSKQFLDHKTINEVFIERFGQTQTRELWQFYRNQYWTDEDFKNCQRLNMNVIRLPFTYMSVDTEYCNVENNNQKYNFSILDNFIARAKQYGLYTILDLHGAYGSQNGHDHSGESKDNVDFYSNSENKDKTKDLWKALANHYKGNPSVAGYDILNEPGEKSQSTTEIHWNYFNELYQEIRKIDNDHIIIFESCWDGSNLPNPNKYHWENCVYSFHNYSGESDPENNLTSMKNKISGVEQMNFNIPLYMGEFACYENPESWEKTLSLFNSKGWHWTNWTYKINRQKENSYLGWSLFHSQAQSVDPFNDSLETIIAKWDELDNLRVSNLESNQTLFAVLEKYYKTTAFSFDNSTLKIEAENAQHIDGKIVDSSFASNNFLVEYITNDLSFIIFSNKERYAKLSIYFSNGSDSLSTEALEVKTNQTSYGKIDLPTTSNWYEDFSSYSFIKPIHFEKGINIITLTKLNGNYNLDYIFFEDIVPLEISTSNKIEAEDAHSTNSVIMESEAASNKKYLGNLGVQYYIINTLEVGDYTLELFYASHMNAMILQAYYITINGKNSQSFNVYDTLYWNDNWKSNSSIVSLKKGLNRITISNGEGGVNIDYFTIKKN